MKKRKDGRYQLLVNLKNPITDEVKRVSVYGNSSREVLAKRDQMLRDYEGGWVSETGATFEAFCVNIFKQKVADKRMLQRTADGYMKVLNKHVFTKLAKNVAVKDLDVMRLKYVINGIDGNRARQYIYTILHSVLKEAVFEGIIESNPCDRIRKPRHKSKPAKFITPEQYSAVMKACEGSQLWYIFFLAFETGMRRGELCGLKWDKVKGNKITVSASLKRHYDGLKLGSPKTEYGLRTIVISPPAVQMLSDWKAILRQVLMSWGLPLENDSFVFRSPKNPANPLDPDFLTHSMAKICKELDLPPRTCLHSFRHTHATMIASLDLSPKKIQTRLGHADAGFTLNRYVHKDNMDEGVLDAISKIEAVYGVVAAKN